MLSNQDVEFLLVHAALQVQYQQPDRAISLLNVVVDVRPHCCEAKRLLAVACLQVGCFARSILLCEELLQLQPQEYESGLWLCISQARWKQSRQEEARQAHRRYVRSLSSQANE
ncbi:MULTISPECIES: tetratricopeptide repeat protein [Vibrio]|uniref:type III secretion apparatus assembly chaperone SctY n=1 Tax=Vibrio TaxID=662 RepID=UPI00056F06C4|nr:hypothetical protein [Vibrio pacinii]